ncbi:MAG: GNAT family N-acetyltransferase [Bacteroidetes bacterium]|nr:GNAT family N-acetyltransferase [Bacteroidota bacterium]
MNYPPYTSFPVLSNARVLLREVGMDDLSTLFDISFYDGEQAKSLDHAVEMFERINNDYASGRSIHWAIIQRSTNEIAGTCGYYRGFTNATGEVGGILLPKFRGMGHMTNAMRLILDFGFGELNLERINAITTTSNFKAIQLLEILGFFSNTRPPGSKEISYFRLPS